MNKVNWQTKKGWPTAIKAFGRIGFGTAPMSAVWCQRRTGNPVNVICELSNSLFSNDSTGKVCSMDFSSKESSFGIWMLGAKTLSKGFFHRIFVMDFDCYLTHLPPPCTEPAAQNRKVLLNWRKPRWSGIVPSTYNFDRRISRPTFDLVGPRSEKWFLQEATRAGKVQE